MPNVNPPVDAAAADDTPEWRLTAAGVEVRVGPERVSDVLPEPAAWRFVHVDADGRRYSGYVWHDGAATA